MKMMTLASLSLCLSLVSCAESTKSTSEDKVSRRSASTEAAATIAPVEQQTTPNEPKVSPNFLNGINEKNAGDIVGLVHVHGTVNFAGGGEVILYETEARNKSEIGRARLSNGAFDFGTLEVGRGFYIVALNKETNSTTIILNADEPDVFIDFKTGRLSASKTANASVENSGWFAFQTAETRINSEIKNLRNGLKEAGAFRARVEGQIKEKQQELIAEQHAVIKASPGTFLAKYLTWKNPKYIGSKGLFFEDIDPLDNSCIRSMAVSDRIQQMMRSFSLGTESGFLGCVDIIKAHFEPNPVTLESALYAMLEGFYNSGKENICQYILDNYIFDEDCGADLSDAIRIRAQGIINLQLGKTPPNFFIEKWDGGSVDLMQTCKQNKYTLVMFWASWCHKCEQEIPNLVPMYSKYHFQDFEIVAVSLDQQRSTWEKAIKANGMEWLNVSQLQAWNCPVVADYKVTATPTYFLLDSEGRIVLKPTRYFQVDEFLKNKL